MDIPHRPGLLLAALGCWAVPGAAQQSPAHLPTIPVTSSYTQLASAEPTDLDPVVVTGTRTEHRLSDSPVVVEVVTARDIMRSGARDLTELLEREGSVHVTRAAGRGSTIEMQGLSSEHVLILVNGRRLSGRINGAIDLSRLRVADIERLEIVKGPSSALYGSDALGGVVNIITRQHQSGGAVNVRNSAYDQDAYGHLGVVGERWSTQFAAGYSAQSAFDLSPQTAAEDSPDAEGWYYAVNAERDIGRSGNLGLDLAYQLDDSQRLDSGTGGAKYDTRKRTEELRLGLNPRVDIAGGRVRVNTYYHRYFDQYLQDQRGTDANTIDEETRDEIAAIGAQFDRDIAGHQWTIGLDHQLETLRSDRITQVAERDRQAVYLQDQLQLWDHRLTLVPGLRYDRDSQFGQQLSPKLALRLDLTDRWLLRAGYGEGYRAPDFKQLLLRFDNGAVGYRVEGNPELQPERSQGFNLAATFYATPQSSLHLSLFSQRVDDLIDLVQTNSGGDTQVYSYRNVTSATLHGGDLQTQWHPNSAWQIKLGYSYLYSRDNSTGDPLSGRPTHRVHTALYYQRAQYGIGLRGNWVGERHFAVDTSSGGPPTGAGTAPAYALFDVRAQWRGWPVAQLAAGIKNLFDAGDSAFLPIAPRAVYMEIQRSFQ